MVTNFGEKGTEGLLDAADEVATPLISRPEFAVVDPIPRSEELSPDPPLPSPLQFLFLVFRSPFLRHSARVVDKHRGFEDAFNYLLRPNSHVRLKSGIMSSLKS